MTKYYYIVFTIYDKNHGEIITPRIFKIKKRKDILDSTIIDEYFRKLKEELVKAYSGIDDAEDIFDIEYHLFDGIPDL